MAHELAFVLVNPYTIRKSRTGGVIGRIIGQTGLSFVATRMMGASQELTERYAQLIAKYEKKYNLERYGLHDYVLRAYAPDPKTGRRHRVLLCLFEGEDAIRKVWECCGSIECNRSGTTVRDVYGDYIEDEHGELMYVEPAVMIGRDYDCVKETLQLWSEFSESDGGIIDTAAGIDEDEGNEKTLVLVKPDNFRFPSARPGKIIDIFSRSGLRMVGAQVHHMTLDEGEEFYGPVREILREKLKTMVSKRALRAINEELKVPVPEHIGPALGDLLGPIYSDDQYYKIIQFMTGCWAPDVADDDKHKSGKERCLALIYAGTDAVEKIRSILGPTDPSKAESGTVRREYGQDIMVNAAHASDSPENAAREMAIIRVEGDTIKTIVDAYYGD